MADIINEFLDEKSAEEIVEIDIYQDTVDLISEALSSLNDLLITTHDFSHQHDEYQEDQALDSEILKRKMRIIVERVHYEE